MVLYAHKKRAGSRTMEAAGNMLIRTSTRKSHESGIHGWDWLKIFMSTEDEDLCWPASLYGGRRSRRAIPF
jgi:DUF971 family protein